MKKPATTVGSKYIPRTNAADRPANPAPTTATSNAVAEADIASFLDFLINLAKVYSYFLVRWGQIMYCLSFFLLIPHKSM